jgi:hypothetical protein
MKNYDIPLVDDENPLYCPTIPAVSFLATIRQQLHGSSGLKYDDLAPTPELSPDAPSDECLLPSFPRLLDKSVTDDDLLELLYNPQRSEIQNLLDQDDADTSSVLNLAGSVHNAVERMVKKEESLGFQQTFSDLDGPLRREKSILSVNEGSFELSGKADRILDFFRGSPYTPHTTKSRRNQYRHTIGKNGWRARVNELQTRISKFEGIFLLLIHVASLRY